MSKINAQQLATLIDKIGGKENIATVSHCLTRLRFVLNDPAKADSKAAARRRVRDERTENIIQSS